MAALSEFIQDGVRYVPTKAIAKEVGLSPRYLADFCRDGHVSAVFHKGAWYVEENSLRAFLDKRAREQEEYNRKLSQEAKAEVERHKAQLAPALPPEPAPLRVHRKPAEVLLATLTIFAVMASGAVAFHNIAPQKFAATLNDASHAPEFLSSQVAAVASLPWLDNFAAALYRTICPIFRDCPRDDVIAEPTQAPQRVAQLRRMISRSPLPIHRM